MDLEAALKFLNLIINAQDREYGYNNGEASLKMGNRTQKVGVHQTIENRK